MCVCVYANSVVSWLCQVSWVENLTNQIQHNPKFPIKEAQPNSLAHKKTIQDNILGWIYLVRLVYRMHNLIWKSIESKPNRCKHKPKPY